MVARPWPWKNLSPSGLLGLLGLPFTNKLRRTTPNWLLPRRLGGARLPLNAQASPSDSPKPQGPTQELGRLASGTGLACLPGAVGHGHTSPYSLRWPKNGNAVSFRLTFRRQTRSLSWTGGGPTLPTTYVLYSTRLLPSLLACPPCPPPARHSGSCPKIGQRVSCNHRRWPQATHPPALPATGILEPCGRTNFCASVIPPMSKIYLRSLPHLPSSSRPFPATCPTLLRPL